MRETFLAGRILINFTKNVGLLGTIMMLAAVPEPWPYSVAARGDLRHSHV